MNHLTLSKPTTQATIALLIVFLIDMFIPLGIAVGVLYLFCFFLVCRQNKKIIIAFAVITSLLTITKLIIFLSPTTNYMVFANRAITIMVIITIAILASRHRTLIDTINAEQNTYTKELEEMLFMTSHRVRKPIASCLGLMNLVENGKTLTQEELNKTIEHLKLSALELDTFTKELTTFIYDIEKKEKKKNWA